MEKAEKKNLKIKACKIRMGVIEGTFHAKSGHPGGSLSAADLYSYLYFKEMNIDPSNPHDPDRDRFVLSKGHCCPGLYAALAERGYFSAEELKSLRHLGALLQGHPDMKTIPGIDMSSGSLPAGSRSPESSTARITACIPCSATARSKKVRFGRPRCSQAIRSWITCA